MSNQVIRSKYSFWSVALALFGCGSGIAMLILGVNEIRPSLQQDILLGLAAIIISLILLQAASICLFAQYEVTLDGIFVKHWWSQRKVKWKDVSVIGFQTYWGWGYTVGIKLENSKERNIFLAPAFVGNNHNIVKAIIEAATNANPGIRFVGMHEFGPPPYGIFSEK